MEKLDLMGLDAELRNVAAEALTLDRDAPEPDYVEILLRAGARHREEVAAAAVVPVDEAARSAHSANLRGPSEKAPPASGNDIVWHDVPVPEETEDRPVQAQESVPAAHLCPGVSWFGDPEKYQERAAMAAVAAGVTIVPWNWVETSCGNIMCLEVKHMIFRKPRRLQYPNGICVYCGEFADTRDHLLPVTYTGRAVRAQVLTVPACRQCNSFIGDAYAPSITERRAIAHSSLRRKRFRLLQAFDYTDAEMDEFGHAMKASVLRARQEKDKLLRRLAFPGDESYDLEYLSLSGIDDPYAFGLIKAGEQARGRRR